MENKIVYCDNCNAVGTMESGSHHGQLYECEDECGKFICTKCLLDNREYQGLLKDSWNGISDLNKIVCINCLDKAI